MKPSVALLKSRLVHRGGLEKYTRYLANAFVAHGCDVTILTTGEAPCFEGGNCVSLAPNTKFSLRHLHRFDKACQAWLAEHPHAIVFGMERTTHQTHYRAGSGVHAAYLERRRLTDSYLKRLSFKVNPLHRLLLKKEKEAFESPDLKLLFTNSVMVKQEILHHYATPPEKIAVVHNGVEWQEWQDDFDQACETPRSGPFHFLFVGNGYERKGLSFLIGALPLLKEEFRLTVVGKDKQVAHYQHLAKQLGVDKAVTFAGPQPDLRPFYAQADALVIPSIYDPFSNVTLEALAMGLFVVSSSYNGGKEILRPDTGCVIEELTTPKSVAAALKMALAHPKTPGSALTIRQSIKELDFTHQLDKMIGLCIS